MQSNKHGNKASLLSGDVYQPGEDSMLVVEFIRNTRMKGKKVLDMGTGSGILAIAASGNGADACACDISPAAVEAARKNSEEAGAEIKFFVSDLFENVHGMYDIIIFNPPYLPEDEEDEIAGKSLHYSGGKGGKEVIERFLKDAGKHLDKNGFILLLASSLTKNADFAGHGFDAEVVGERKLWFEKLFLFRLKHKS